MLLDAQRDLGLPLLQLTRFFFGIRLCNTLPTANVALAMKSHVLGR
jgi:hypothetical protein